MDNILLMGYEQAKSKIDDFNTALTLEAKAKEIHELIKLEKEFPSKSTLQICKEFLIDVEKWKMMSIKCRLGNAAINSGEEIYSAFRGACLKSGDKDKLLSIMNLKGFGSHIDENFNRRAKAASAVMRFFYPETWGVVDWRVLAVLVECEKHSWDASFIINNTERADAKELRCLYDIITEDTCIWLNAKYRSIVKKSQLFERVSDVDMALFQFSLRLWPF